MIFLVGCGNGLESITKSSPASNDEASTILASQEESTSVANGSIIERVNALVTKGKAQYSYPGDIGHITIKEGIISQLQNHNGEYTVTIVDAIDGILYLDEYPITEQDYKTLKVDTEYTVK